MKCCDGVWFPDSEVHLVKMIRQTQRVGGKGTYQYQKLVAAVQHVSQRRLAVDVGMHVGLWSMHLARMFQRVIGFEPVAENIECLRANMQGFDNYQVHNWALGAQHRMASLKFMDGSTGSTTLLHTDDGTVQVVPLDSFGFAEVDFIKIDVEGYERFVIEGAEETIRRCRPVVIVEQKGTKGIVGRGEQYDAINLLKAWGAREAFQMAGDFCMVFEN